MRIEVFYKSKYKDGRALRLASSLKTHFNINIKNLKIIDVFIIQGHELSREEVLETFADPVAQDIYINSFYSGKDTAWDIIAEITYKPGVTDPVAITARDALKNNLNIKSGINIQTARQYLIKTDTPRMKYSDVTGSLYNPLIQNSTVIDKEKWNNNIRPPMEYNYHVKESPLKVETFNLSEMDNKSLKQLSKERLLALSIEEMMSIKNQFSDPEIIEYRKHRGLTTEITDVELEMLAQTWSEHCKHKIFQANINYKENGKSERIESVFKTYIKDTTDKVSKKKNYLRSVFHDNSGVIDFDENTVVCFKVETHNSPSALDPYGGAITGIVGVNRDIIGTGIGARPIFNTNVLCFADPDISQEKVPKGLLHPRRVMEGVHQGIIDGGNQSGIPVAGGAFLFDESYIGKPLVFCGTGGIMPVKINGEDSWVKHIDSGDLAVMLGGRIGKDGIHGATFSSQALDDDSPLSAVQIGDPITQKKMLDFLMEARDLGLYKGITDNGAGGLSSSLGEMAEYCGGIKIELDKCPLKYSGLAPWEILVSESQERMCLSVSKDKIKQFLNLADSREVEATVVGEFNNSGYIDILYDGECVGLLGMEFLHNGLPVMELEAVWEKPERPVSEFTGTENIKNELLKLLSDPNIASKEELVRQYDHEVQAQSVVKPFSGIKEDGPSDGAVLRPDIKSSKGLTVTHGICPRYSDYDTYHMAMCAVDEALRAHVACGGNPEKTSALDNFCWPDPILSENNPDGPFKLAQLVRACKGLNRVCEDYGIPLISGKDSMKNDAIAEGRKLSVRPTLLVSLMGIIPDIKKSMTTDFKKEGDLIYIAGITRGELWGSAYERLLQKELDTGPQVDTKAAFYLYKAVFNAIQSGFVSSCHDISEGGIAVALCESAFGGRLGAQIDLSGIPVTTGKNEIKRILFCETASRFIISVPEGKKEYFENIFKNIPLGLLGNVTGDSEIIFKMNDKSLININLLEIEEAWKTPI